MAVLYDKFISKPGNANVLAVTAIDIIETLTARRIRAYINRAYVIATDPTLQWVLFNDFYTSYEGGSEKAGTELRHPVLTINIGATLSPILTCGNWSIDCAPTISVYNRWSFFALRVRLDSINHPEMRGKYLTPPIGKVANPLTSVVCSSHP